MRRLSLLRSCSITLCVTFLSAHARSSCWDIVISAARPLPVRCTEHTVIASVGSPRRVASRDRPTNISQRTNLHATSAAIIVEASRIDHDLGSRRSHLGSMISGLGDRISRSRRSRYLESRRSHTRRQSQRYQRHAPPRRPRLAARCSRGAALHPSPPPLSI